jgi:hypothetical protein
MISREISFLENHIEVLKLLRDVFSNQNYVYYHDNTVFKHHRNKITDTFNQMDTEQQEQYFSLYSLYI